MAYKNYNEFFDPEAHDQDWAAFLKKQGFRKSGGGYEKNIGYGITVKVRLSIRTGDLSVRFIKGGEARVWCKLHDFAGREGFKPAGGQGGGATLEKELRDVIPEVNDVIDNP
ncbi:MAG: hypothetical protein J6Y62_04525 [Clostridia bacterium]|nr:hypothetical protein [Clostridia bacterium]